MQPGDVPRTYADIDNILKDYNYKPSTTINSGLKLFIDWYISNKKR